MAAIYVGRGLDPALASKVAGQLELHEAIGTHARDELDIPEIMTPRLVQAALASATTFSVGAALPLVIALFTSAVSIM